MGWGTFMNSHGIRLVVEDDCDIRDLLSLVLSRAGFEVHAQAAGNAGLQAARAVDPVLITLDVGLQDPNGYEVAHRSRKLPADRILMITASPYTGEELDLLAASADVHLTKPFHPDRLVELAQQLCPSTPRGATTTGPCQIMMALEPTGLDRILQPQDSVEECLR